MNEVHRQHVEWHDPSCSSLDVIQTPTFVTCLSCGSSGPPPPPALHIPLPDDSSIRLLLLLSGDFDDPIKCHLRICSLSSTLIFSAISYTWADENGDDRKCEEIILNGQPFQVSRNCHTALKRVRQVTHTAAIWIDAICIDQCNTEERGHQVKLMSEIYLRAQRVFVYVGEHNNESRDLLDMIGQLSQPQVPGRTKTLLGLISKSAWNSFLARRYFSRLWILQELALAKHAIILCGNSSLAWAHFAYYSRLMNKFHKLEENAIFMFERSLYLSPNKELLLLDHGRWAYATDPRDKIYGLLGLLPAKRLGSIIADYTLSVEQLYMKVALEIAKLHGWGAVLNRAGIARQNLSSLPSWVPDWSFSGKPREGGSKLGILQCHTDEREQIRLRLAKCIGDNDQWLFLGKSDGPLQIYFSLSTKSKLYQHNIGPQIVPDRHLDDEGRTIFTTHGELIHQDVYLSLTTQPSFDRMTRSLCSTTMGVTNDSTTFVHLGYVLSVFPLRMEEISTCAVDRYTLHLENPTSTEVAGSPSRIRDLLLGEYHRLSAAGPVQDWVLEAEELWVDKYQKTHPLEEVYDEPYAANDAFWRLLVRRFALKEQTVNIV